VASRLGGPFILKPRRDGSSVGLHLVRNEADFDGAGKDLVSTEYLAEPYLEGFDLTVGVFGGEALGVVAVHPEGGLYDYKRKYTSGLSRYDVPADLPQELARRLQEWSLTVFHTCGCRDLARVDFRMDAGGNPVFLEVNTLPGMTPTSLLPKSAQCRNMSFADLVLGWAGFALQRKEGQH
jgi:D-alanine-D-alanine ligase